MFYKGSQHRHLGAWGHVHNCSSVSINVYAKFVAVTSNSAEAIEKLNFRNWLAILKTQQPRIPICMECLMT